MAINPYLGRPVLPDCEKRHRISFTVSFETLQALKSLGRINRSIFIEDALRIHLGDRYEQFANPPHEDDGELHPDDAVEDDDTLFDEQDETSVG